MNEELNKKLAEWAGCKFDPEWMPYHSNGNLYCDTKGNIIEYPPNFTGSLDACVKRLLPKFDWQQIIFQPDGYCGITINDELYEAEADEKLALALCLAIEKMVRNEG